MADNTCHTIEKFTLHEFMFSTVVPLYVSDTVSETSKFQDLDMANLYLWNTKYHCDSSKTLLYSMILSKQKDLATTSRQDLGFLQ